jgi:hypothetical protein
MLSMEVCKAVLAGAFPLQSVRDFELPYKKVSYFKLRVKGIFPTVLLEMEKRRLTEEYPSGYGNKRAQR